jgi:replication factor C subunit 3/5
MSDYEDEMDLDAPIDGAGAGAGSAKDPVMFGSSDGKGKRSAANLPVEAEDSLPWCVIILTNALFFL